MGKQKKRALRRHHIERVRRKYLHVAKRWAGPLNGWLHVYHHEQFRPTVPVIDPEGYVKRERSILRSVQRLVGHHKCPCGLCKLPRYDRRAADREFHALCRSLYEE